MEIETRSHGPAQLYNSRNYYQGNQSNYSAKKQGSDRRLDGGEDKRKYNGKNGYNKYDSNMPYNDNSDDDNDDGDYQQNYRTNKQTQRRNQGGNVDRRQFNGKNGYNKNDPNLPYNDAEDDDDDDNDYQQNYRGNKQGTRRNKDGTVDRRQFNGENLRDGTALSGVPNNTHGDDSEDDHDYQQDYRTSKKGLRRNQDGTVDKRQTQARRGYNNYNDEDDYERGSRGNKGGLRRNMDGSVDQRQFNGENLRDGTALSGVPSNSGRHSQGYSSKNNRRNNQYDDSDDDDYEQDYRTNKKGTRRNKDGTLDRRQFNGENLRDGTALSGVPNNTHGDDSDDDNNYQQSYRGNKQGTRRNKDGTIDKRQFNGENLRDGTALSGVPNNTHGDDSDDDNDYQQNYRTNKQTQRRNQGGNVDRRQFNGKNGYNKNDPNLPYNDAEDDDDDDNDYQQDYRGNKQGTRRNKDGTVDRRQFNGENLQGGTARSGVSNNSGRSGQRYPSQKNSSNVHATTGSNQYVTKYTDGTMDRRDGNDQTDESDDNNYQQNYRGNKQGQRRNQDGSIDQRQYNGKNLPNVRERSRDNEKSHERRRNRNY